jgi:hypothetical protein
MRYHRGNPRSLSDMRKTEFVKGLSTIASALKATELVDRMAPLLNLKANQPIGSEAKTSFAALIFESQTNFQRLLQDDDTSAILRSLNLARLYSSENLGELMTLYRNATSTASIASVAASFAIFCRFYEFFRWLLTFREASSSLLNWEHIDPILVTDKVLELELFDFDGGGIEIIRIQDLFSALEDLRIQVSLILQLPESRLRLSYIESGSNITIDVKGLGELVDSISNLIGQGYALIANRKFNKLDRRNSSIAGQLTLIDRVSQMVTDKSITPEEGELFKQKLLNDTQRLFESGAMLRAVPVAEPLSTITVLAEQRETNVVLPAKTRHLS